VHGHKLRGRLILVRRGSDRSGKEQWLLLHKRDEYAISGWEPGDYPRSVLSGRTNDEVKADPARLWRSDLDALDNLGPAGTWQVFGRQLRLTNLDKLLFP
jgi:bifunctional non-homologous end joining protein LigD